ncbi:MAG: DNA-directed RNA polymerase subunit A'' [Candidatus Woesearchaeota archaeon]
MYEKIIEKYQNLLPKKIIDEIISNLPSNKKISDEKVEEIFRKVYQDYVATLLEPGHSIGLITAQSFGEPATQMTLDTFHLAGVSELNISVGLPRIIELFDGRKTTKTPITFIYLVPPYNTKEYVRSVALRLKETSLKEIMDSVELDLMNYSVRVNLNSKILADLEMTPQTVLGKLKKYIKNIEMGLEKNMIFIKFPEDIDIKFLYKFKENIKSYFISGVKGIKYVLPKEIEYEGKKEYMILAAGQNLGELLKLDFVDPYRTYSNDIYEVYTYLGVEAARELLFREILNVVSEQGLNIDLRYISLIADVLMAYGEYRGITRYGLMKSKSSVLARATFETPITHFIDAALVGEKERLIGLMEAVIVGQPPAVGTTLSQVYFVSNPKSKQDEKNKESKQENK